MTAANAQDDWKQIAGDAPTFDMVTLRRAADRFDRQIFRRNLIECGAVAFVVMLFGARFLHADSIIEKIGSLLVVGAALFVAATLLRAGRHRGPAMALPAARMREELRADLERQATLLEGVRTWYLAPFLPGFALLFIEPALSGTWYGIAGSAISFAVGLAIVVFIDRLNRKAASELRRRIALLD